MKFITVKYEIYNGVKQLTSYFKNNDIVSEDELMRRILVREQTFTPQELTADMITNLSIENENDYDFLYGNVILNTGDIVEISELNPLSSIYIEYGLKNVYNINIDDVKEHNLYTSDNKILFLNKRGNFMNLTHEEFKINATLNSENYEDFKEFTASAVIKNLL